MIWVISVDIKVPKINSSRACVIIVVIIFIVILVDIHIHSYVFTYAYIHRGVSKSYHEAIVMFILDAHLYQNVKENQDIVSEISREEKKNF